MARSTAKLSAWLLPVTLIALGLIAGLVFWIMIPRWFPPPAKSGDLKTFERDCAPIVSWILEEKERTGRYPTALPPRFQEVIDRFNESWYAACTSGKHCDLCGNRWIEGQCEAGADCALRMQQHGFWPFKLCWTPDEGWQRWD